jgi:two-component system response regulator AtoC
MQTEKLKKVLVVDDEENMRHMLASLLGRNGYEVLTAGDGGEALVQLGKSAFDIVLCDLKMPRMDGLAFLRAAADFLDKTTFIVMSAYGTIDTAVQAMKAGAYDYISKPFKFDEILMVLRKANERERLKIENRRLLNQIEAIRKEDQFLDIIGKSPAMRSVFKLVEKVADYTTTVLITGESGTGKEMVAKSIHCSGNRSKHRMVSVNCGGIPENLLESELFGYKKGAFTGASQDKAGLIQDAHLGTLFLDEIGELPLPLQVKLLRVLQESELRPIGANQVLKIDTRVIAATSKDLEKEVQTGAFRQDLFYRLNVLNIKLPPLRDRSEDIPLLCEHFCGIFNQKLQKNIKAFSSGALACLLKYPWPGNVRELENVVERTMVLAEDETLGPEHLPERVRLAGDLDPMAESAAGHSLKVAQRLLEKKMIARALRETKGNRSQAARLLEISHPCLLSKIKTHEISG